MNHLKRLVVVAAVSATLFVGLTALAGATQQPNAGLMQPIAETAAAVMHDRDNTELTIRPWIRCSWTLNDYGSCIPSMLPGNERMLW